MQQLRALSFAFVALLAIAFAATGLGHRLSTAEAAQLDVIAQMGGGVIELCSDLNGDGLPDDPCPLCHLGSPAVVPVGAATAYRADFAILLHDMAPRASRAVRPVLDPAHGLRAPPRT